MAKASNTQWNETLDHAPTSATDFIDAAVWPGRITRNGNRVSGFIYDLRYQHIIERLAITNTRNGYHQFCLPVWLRNKIGRPDNNYTTLQVHILIFRLQWGRWPECQVDHIYGLHDNRAGNIRLITRSGNNRNKQKPKADGLPWGVSWDASRNKYRAQVTDANGALKYLGRYTDIEAAAAAVDLFNEELIAEDNRLSDLMTQGLVEPERRTLSRGVSLCRNGFAARINAGGRIYLGTFPTPALASMAHESARVIRATGGTVDQMKQAARDATATSSIELGGCE